MDIQVQSLIKGLVVSIYIDGVYYVIILISRACF
jgi:hypothetical protein